MYSVENYINNFFDEIASDKVEIYNEFSLQHELGHYLREKLPKNDYKIQFERPASYFVNTERLVKKEIDIAIFNQDHSQKYAIELKYPKNGQHPEQMFQFCKDICFMEQLVTAGFDAGYFIVAVDDPLFYRDEDAKGIYQYFRGGKEIHGLITKPTGLKGLSFQINGYYRILWKPIKLSSKYAIVSVEKQLS